MSDTQSAVVGPPTTTPMPPGYRPRNAVMVQPAGQAGVRTVHNDWTPATLPPPPALSSLSPASAPSGPTTPPFMVQIFGSGFVNGDVVVFDGWDMPTTFVSATELDFPLGPHDAAATYDVWVRLGVVVSNVVGFTFS